MSNSNKNFRLLIPAIVSIIIISWILLLPPLETPVIPDQTPDPDMASFGNSTLGGSIALSSKVIDPSAYMQAKAEHPRVIFEDNFENPSLSSNWTIFGNVSLNFASGYLSDQSVDFVDSTDNESILENVYQLDAISDEKYKMFFFVNISAALASGMGYNNEYFAVRLAFSDGTELVYIVAGLYNSASNSTCKIFVLPHEGDNTIEYGMWSGISIESIRDDYETEFGYAIPTINTTSFVFFANGSSKAVSIDQLQITSVPIQISSESYWAYNEIGDRLWSWRVELNYTVYINATRINSDDVWIEINLYLYITDHDANPIIGTSDTPQFILFDLVKVDSFNTSLHWNTTTFYPRENNLFNGNPEAEVTYEYIADVFVYGNIKNSEGDPTDKYVTANAQDTTSRMMWWIEIEGSIDLDIELYVIGGLGALTAGGATFYISKRKKSHDFEAELTDYINK